MATTEQILQAAGDLGKMVAEHTAAKTFADTTAKLHKDTDAQRTLNDYHRHVQSLQEKQSAGKPIEVEDKRRLEKLQQNMVKNPLLRDLQMVQMDYLDLMRKVDQAMAIQDQSAAQSPALPAEAPIVNPEVGKI